MKLKFIILALLSSLCIFAQDSDSLLLQEIKSDCNIIVYKNSYWKTYFGNEGEFIKAYSVFSKDKMVDFSISMSTQDTIYKLKLAAFGNIWVTNANSVDGIGKYGEKIHIDDVPITVKYDQQIKKYFYEATIEIKAPFKNESDKALFKEIYNLASCTNYRIYVFDRVFSESKLFFPCFNYVISQSLDSDKKYLFQQSIEEDIKEAKKSQNNKTKEKSKKN